MDQGGLNPPERDDWKFPGPHVHWDASIAPPHCFGVQGILYLTDTPADQGAFSCIPGFHRTLDQWLNGLPPSEDPRQAILRHPGLQPIAGKAGDLEVIASGVEDLEYQFLRLRNALMTQEVRPMAARAEVRMDS